MTYKPMTPTEIKKARLKRLLTQAQFGAILGGYSQTDVSHWEKGITTIPKAVKALLELQADRSTKCFLSCVLPDSDTGADEGANESTDNY